MKSFIVEARRAILACLMLGLLLSAVYPLVVCGIGRLLFPAKASGSLLESGGRTVGSLLIAQRFASPAYFHPRPSAVDYGEHAAGSGGFNQGPLSRDLFERLDLAAGRYREENGLPPGTPVPSDAVTASASGLDPHISPADAMIQAVRVAKARGWSMDRVLGMVRRTTERRQLGIFGEERVNVLRLNLALNRKDGMI